VVIDGPGPFTFTVLPPQVLIVVLSASAFFLERRLVRDGSTCRRPSRRPSPRFLYRYEQNTLQLSVPSGT